MKTKLRFTLHRKSGNASLKKGNEMISSNDRYHPIVKSQITKHLREKAKASIDVEKPIYSDKNPCKITVTVYAPTKRRMDAPNWYPTVKALLDGLTDAGLWVDDNNDVIKEITFTYGGLSGSKDYNLDLLVEKYGVDDDD